MCTYFVCVYIHIVYIYIYVYAVRVVATVVVSCNIQCPHRDSLWSPTYIKTIHTRRLETVSMRALDI